MERRPRVCGVVEEGAWRHCRPPSALVSKIVAVKSQTATHRSATVAVKAYGRSLCVICASALVVDGLDDSLELPCPPAALAHSQSRQAIYIATLSFRALL